MRAVMLVESGFQDEEFVYPYYRMLEEGWSVGVATPDGKDRTGKFGVPARATQRTDFAGLPDVLVIPGGFESPDRLRAREEVQALVKRMDEAGRVIAAICHGPWVLVSAGICKGRTLTGYDSITPDLWNAGAIVRTDVGVVRDRNLITARHYRDNGAFMREVIQHACASEWGMEVCAAAVHL